MIGDKYFNTGDLFTASFWYQMAANKGHSHSQFRLGFFYHFNGDYSNAMKWYHQGYINGSTNVTKSIGIMYSLGLGVAQNDETAFK